MATEPVRLDEYPPVDFLALEPVEIDTDDAVYQKFRIQYADGVAQIVARSGLPIRSATGTLTVTQTQRPIQWRLAITDGSEGDWTITRTRGCNCSGQPIIQKT